MSRITLATMYGAGLSPKAPGTVGSLVAACLAYGILQLPHGWELLAVGTLVFTILGTRSADRYMQEYQSTHDPKEIVIDELAGQWLTYLVNAAVCYLLWLPMDRPDLSAGMKQAILTSNMALWSSASTLFCGFLLFRFFDILKPWPIGWFDRKVKGGFGVMLDDLLAAIPAGILITVVLVAMEIMLHGVE